VGRGRGTGVWVSCAHRPVARTEVGRLFNMRLRIPHLTLPLRPRGRRGIALSSLVATLALSLIALPATAEPAMWVAKSGGATVYLFGTVHALKSETDWETPKISAAFAESQELWLEADDADPTTMQPIVAKLGIDRAHKLSAELSPADLPRLEAAAKAAGLPGEAALEPMRPWLAALTLAALPIVKAGYDPAKGVDNVLKAKALATGKPVHGLESAEQQMHFFADFPQARQVEMLREVLDEVAGGPAQIEELLAAWAAGDLATIDKDMNQDNAEKYPDLYAVLIVSRNRAWAEKVAARLKSGQGVTFMAVGAAHLVGRDSVQKALEARGISVARD
jgi:uncharacterized protein YbaP (TraB family)